MGKSGFVRIMKKLAGYPALPCYGFSSDGRGEGVV